jgi:hypothetical protein
MTKCFQVWTQSAQTLETGSSQFHCNVNTKNTGSYNKSWIFFQINKKNASVYVPTVGLITHQLLGAACLVAILEKQTANLFRNVQFCNRA